MKNVLISGGSGSFGNAFVRRLLENKNIERIVVYSRDEQKQETMARELSEMDRDQHLRFFIGDVRDISRLEFAMHGIDTVIHAAALKIVPTLEYNPTECIATNIGGAENVVKAAIRSGVKKVIALSTDKAVNPINLYGASKLAAEKIFVAANALAAGQVRFSVVRYGNIMGSRGSVLPLFKKIAADGGMITVTDERMTRFWMIQDQAIDLVLFCHKVMTGREIFIPKIPSIRITDLATVFSPRFEVIGIRAGEKLHECLMTEDESRIALENEHYYCINYNNEFRLPGWRNLRDGFRYASDTNTKWLSVEQLRAML